MKKTSTLLLSAIFIASLISWSLPEKSGTKENTEVRNIVLMIGDGMGLATVYSAMTVSHHPLNIERCNIIGLQKTFSSDHYITDSGAATTAIATGNKTNNGAMAMDSQGRRVKSILEIAKENGLATGLVTTSAITDATPASFITHESSRNNPEDIAKDFLKTGIDVFIGGGYDHFANRKDNLNLIDSLKVRGYEVETSMNALIKSTSLKLAGLIAPVNNPYRLNGRGDMLPASSRKAIEILNKNPKGFFLMIEGGEIDLAAHAKDATTLIDETIDFDEAVGEVLDFAQNDGHTLVVITADHETGGVAIIGGNIRAHKVLLIFPTISHTAVMVPVYAYGPGAEKFGGIYDNTELFQKFLTSYGFEELK
ncbi:MAG: alkaline phosphatase [Bacteroidia bacterium]|nr:alkaline phosphatase [Bacteroidia bacterium]